jgi:anti-sigma factor RsiW
MPISRDHCSWTRHRIELYVDGELEGAERDAFEKHVESCEGCSEELALATAVMNGLRSLPLERCPDRVVDEAEARAGVATVPGPFRRLQDWFGARVVSGLRPAMAVMVIVVVAATAFVLWRHEQSPFNRNNDRPEVAGEYTEQELELARLDAMLAFAYLGKYSRRTEEIVAREVITDRVIRPVERSVVDPMYPFPRDK